MPSGKQAMKRLLYTKTTGGAWRCPTVLPDTTANSLNGVTIYNLVATICRPSSPSTNRACRRFEEQSLHDEYDCSVEQ